MGKKLHGMLNLDRIPKELIGTNKNGEKVYSVQIIAEEIEFAESKNSQGGGNGDGGFDRPAPENASADGFMTIPGGAEDSLPFK